MLWRLMMGVMWHQVYVIDDKGGGGVPPVPPPVPVPVPPVSSEAANAAVLKAVQDALKPVLEPLTKLQADLPGMVKRHVSEAMESLTGRVKVEGDETMTKQMEVLQGQISAQTTEITTLRTTAETERKENALTKAWDKANVKVSASTKRLALPDIASRVQKNDKGQFFMEITVKQQESGAESKKQVTLDEGIAHYFKVENTDLLIADIVPSVGARGGAEGADLETLTYQQLFDNPNLMTAFLEKNGEQKLHDLRKKWEAEKRKK